MKNEPYPGKREAKFVADTVAMDCDSENDVQPERGNNFIELSLFIHYTAIYVSRQRQKVDIVLCQQNVARRVQSVKKLWSAPLISSTPG